MIKVLNVVKNSNKIVGYNCTDGKQVRLITKEQLAKFIDARQCLNATKQVYKGQIIIRLKEKLSVNTMSTMQKNNTQSVKTATTANVNGIKAKEATQIKENALTHKKESIAVFAVVRTPGQFVVEAFDYVNCLPVIKTYDSENEIEAYKAIRRIYGKESAISINAEIASLQAVLDDNDELTVAHGCITIESQDIACFVCASDITKRKDDTQVVLYDESVPRLHIGFGKSSDSEVRTANVSYMTSGSVIAHALAILRRGEHIVRWGSAVEDIWDEMDAYFDESDIAEYEGIWEPVASIIGTYNVENRRYYLMKIINENYGDIQKNELKLCLVDGNFATVNEFTCGECTELELKPNGDLRRQGSVYTDVIGDIFSDEAIAKLLFVKDNKLHIPVAITKMYVDLDNYVSYRSSDDVVEGLQGMIRDRFDIDDYYPNGEACNWINVHALDREQIHDETIYIIDEEKVKQRLKRNYDIVFG